MSQAPSAVTVAISSFAGIWASRSGSIPPGSFEPVAFTGSTSPTLLEVTSTARISSVSSSIPRWILRREPCPPLVRGPWRALRFDPPCLRVCHSPSPSTLMPVLSTSRCNGPLEPRNGMTTSKVFCRRERVLKSGTAQPSPESSRRLATKPAAGSQRRCRLAGGHAALTALLPTASRDRTRRSEIHAASAPGYTRANWWSCRSVSAVCPCHSATTLDSQSESQASFVQQGLCMCSICSISTDMICAKPR